MQASLEGDTAIHMQGANIMTEAVRLSATGTALPLAQPPLQPPQHHSGRALPGAPAQCRCGHEGSILKPPAPSQPAPASYPVEGCDTEELEAGAHDDGGGLAEEQPGVLLRGADDLALGVEAVEGLAEGVEVLRDAVRHQLLEGVLHGLRELGQVQRQRLLQGRTTRMLRHMFVGFPFPRNISAM